jgi:demethylmenaquinone methyltransferase / 2-methoxy-6-polyprenyl-1,4-benzoquinol methylase
MAGSPLPPAESKATEVRRMFGAIAPRYDLLNHLLSLNRDRAWRRSAVDRLLDGAARDGTLPRCLRRNIRPGRGAGRPPRFHAGTCSGSISRFPCSLPAAASSNGRRILPACADALALPLPDAAVDGAMVAFGVRNLADLDAGLASSPGSSGPAAGWSSSSS